MSDVIKLPPPRRWVLEGGTDEVTGEETITLVECTGTEDPVYMVGLESPWYGCTLEDLEKWAREGEYGACSASALQQILEAKQKVERGE